MGRRKSKINIHNFSTRRQTKSSDLVDSDLVDRISVLPDSILSVILSFLPTKEAVATSILSKRWKFAWQTVHNLDFYYDGSKAEKEDEAMNFFEFVNRVLHVVGLLSNFRLVCRKPIYISSSRVSSWINTAISKKVHELSLTLSGKFDIPTSFFTYDSLQSLEFTSSIISVSDSVVICLPRLQSLKLDSVYFESEQAFENLINGCPLLNFLHLHISNKDFKCIISSVSLRHLEIHFEYESSLKLKASSLEYLRLIGDISEIFVEERLSSLVEADFGFFLRHKFRNNSIVEAVRTLDCAKVLTLSATVMQALSRAKISLSTEFKRLVKLVVGNRGPLQDLIHSSDNLQVLIINRDPEDPYDEDIKRSTFVEVPRFLSNSLKKVQIDGYSGSKIIREMIRLMLKHGSVLEVMEIFNDEDEYETYESAFEERFQLLQKICEFPRKSPACEVRFLSWNDSPHSP